MDSFVKQELLDRLAEIEAGIATGASNILRQREHVAELERIGLDAKLSPVLKSFEDSQAIRREELGRLVHELGSSGSEPKTGLAGPRLPSLVRSRGTCLGTAPCQRIKNAIQPPGKAAMYLSNQSLLVIIAVGVISGWLAGQIMHGTGFGLVGDLVIGLLGAFIGDWLVPKLDLHLGVGIVALIVNALIGAMVLLLILRLVEWRGAGWGYRRRW
jgi:uncharacterized membrane protein YeaQ/YmgE (transglycosylase-associated protein family)